MSEARARNTPTASYVLYRRPYVIPGGQAPLVLNRPHTITAETEVPDHGVEGVIVAHGGLDGGYALYVKDNRLHYVHSCVASEKFVVSSARELPRGRVTLRFQFEPTGKPDIPNGRGTPGRAALYVNGAFVAERELPYTVPLVLGFGGGLTVGRAEGSPVGDYFAPFEFTGKLTHVTIDVSGSNV
jgi:hypothetical protein